jgi:hypothetical protein
VLLWTPQHLWWLPTRHGDPPTNECVHGPDLERQDQTEQRHLRPEDTIAEVVRRGFLCLTEKAPEPRHDPQQRGQSPGGIATECTSKRLGGKRRSQHNGASRDGSGAEREREQVDPSQKETKHDTPRSEIQLRGTAT